MNQGDSNMQKDESQAIALREAAAVAPTVQMGLLAGDNPTEFLESASAIATQLNGIIENQKGYTLISRKKHVHVDMWTALAAMMGYVPSVVDSHEREDGGWEATVKLVRIADGHELMRAQHTCGAQGDAPWDKRNTYAKQSMAITRATGKCCRLVFSWIMVMAGYSPTPAEEMPKEDNPTPPPKKEPARKKAEPKPELMTDAQKEHLQSLTSEDGLGSDLQEYIKKALEKGATKVGAQKLIDESERRIEVLLEDAEKKAQEKQSEGEQTGFEDVVSDEIDWKGGN